MGLANGYGLVIGPKSNYFRDPPDNFGRYYHGNVIIHTPAGEYHCAIDVDPKFMPDGVQWRVVNIRAQDFAAFKALSDGWHVLQSSAASGALDYIRSGVLHPPILFWNVRYSSCVSWPLNFLRWNPPWNSGTGIQALTDLEGLIARARGFTYSANHSLRDWAFTIFTRTRAIRRAAGTTPKTPSGRMARPSSKRRKENSSAS